MLNNTVLKALINQASFFVSFNVNLEFRDYY